MQFTHGKLGIEKTCRGLKGYVVPEIYDYKDGGRIELIVDEDTLDGIRAACEDASKDGGRWDELLKAIHSYNEYKKAQRLVTQYSNAAAFNGKR
jgi:hypothetical protein